MTDHISRNISGAGTADAGSAPQDTATSGAMVVSNQTLKVRNVPFALQPPGLTPIFTGDPPSGRSRGRHKRVDDIYGQFASKRTRPDSSRSKSPRPNFRIGTVDADVRSHTSQVSSSTHTTSFRSKRTGDDGAVTLQGRVRLPPVRVKAKDHRTGFNWVARVLLGGLFAAGGAIGGAALTSFTFVGIPVAAVAGALGGLALGVALADSLFGRPQRAHLDRAIDAIRLDRRKDLTWSQSHHLAQITDRQWRKLLHVPSKKLLGANQVEGPERRQAIRQELVLEIADRGSLDDATKLKTALLKAAPAIGGGSGNQG